VEDKKVTIGVDPLAAAEWLEKGGTSLRKVAVSALSILLILSAAAALVASLAGKDYWLFLAIPIQAASFYLSNPSSPHRKWMTIGGAVSLLVFLDLLVNGYVTAAVLVAYAGLTFAVVRTAGYISNAAFRKALESDELLFRTAFAKRGCTVLEKKGGKVYESRAAAEIPS
jgi:hypothetical protein